MAWTARPFNRRVLHVLPRLAWVKARADRAQLSMQPHVSLPRQPSADRSSGSTYLPSVAEIHSSDCPGSPVAVITTSLKGLRQFREPLSTKLGKHMTGNINNAITTPQTAFEQAIFDTFAISARGKLPAGSFTANIQLEEDQFAATRYRPQVKRVAMPTYGVGSLVVILVKDHCTRVGTVTTVFDDDTAPSFEIYVSAMLEAVPMKLPRLRVVDYEFVAIHETQNFAGGIRKLSRDQAASLRAKIGQFVPKKVLGAFWTDAELNTIKANVDAQQQHEDAISALIEAVERGNVAA